MAQEPAGNQPSHLVNQAVGLLVFLGGVVLLALVFLWAYRLYQDVDTGMFAVRTAEVKPVVPGVVPPVPLPSGTLTATPGSTKGLAPVIIALVAKLLVLLAMGWIGALIASKGIGLAVGPGRAVDKPAG